MTVRAFSLSGIALLICALFWYSRSGVARPEPPAQEASAPKPPVADCEANRSCPGSALSSPPAVMNSRPEAGGSTASHEQEVFRKLVKEAWFAIPLKSQLQARKSHELHYTPPEVTAAVERVGQIDEALDADPSLVPLGVKFLKACAIHSDFPTSVRALCFHRLRGRLARAETEALTENEVPEDVRHLADQLDQESE